MKLGSPGRWFDIPPSDRTSILPAFLILYAALYLAYGTQSAYLPAFLQSHGLAVEQIGLVLAAGTVIRIGAGPLTGRLADYLEARKQLLALAACLSSFIGLTYNLAFGFAALLVVSMLHAGATASLAPLSDALSVAAARERAFQYGWVRGAGSIAFIGGTLASGQLIDRFGLSSIILTSSVFFLIMAICAATMRGPADGPHSAEANDGGAIRALLGIAAYRRLLIIGFLVIGSHALNDTFAVIQWRRAGYDNLSISLMWSEAVVAEVIVFFLVGPWLIERLGVAGAAALSAGAAMLRWSVMASTSEMSALIGAQALHGLTFALLHLAAMGIMARFVPDRLAATGQTIYGTGALGIASAIMTTASGYLYGMFGAQSFWAMAACCAIALPLTRRLNVP
jgi:MFS transporter, PPP family, 3-phenylpropionic acid transporter